MIILLIMPVGYFYIQVLYFKIMFMQMSDSASWVCTEPRKMGILNILANIDAFSGL